MVGYNITADRMYVMKKLMIAAMTLFLVGAVSAVFASGKKEQPEDWTVTKPREFNKIEKVGQFIYTLKIKGIDNTKTNIFGPYNENEWQNQHYKDELINRKLGLGCSSVRNGDFHGRNLDIYMTDLPVLIVWTEKGEEHFASMGLTVDPNYFLTLLKEHDLAVRDDEKLAENLDIAPLAMMDGINENGVVINMNMLPGEDVNNDKGSNPCALELSYYMVPRFVLDHATSARHAVDLLKERNIVQKPKLFEMHFMISDPKETLVVEVVNNELKVIENPHIMTNYFLSLPLTTHAIGFERKDLIEKYYAEGNTLEGMSKLMSRVAYTQTYKLDTKPFWYSEHFGYYEDIDKDFTINTPKDDKDFVKHIESEAKNATAASLVNNPGMIWDTLSTSVYNIKNKTLRLFIHENYNRGFDFKLN